MLSQKEKLNNIQELKNDILQRIANNDELINVINSMDPTLSMYLVLLIDAVNHQDEVWIEKRNSEWCIVADKSQSHKESQD